MAFSPKCDISDETGLRIYQTAWRSAGNFRSVQAAPAQKHHYRSWSTSTCRLYTVFTISNENEVLFAFYLARTVVSSCYPLIIITYRVFFHTNLHVIRAEVSVRKKALGRWWKRVRVNDVGMRWESVVCQLYVILIHCGHFQTWRRAVPCKFSKFPACGVRNELLVNQGHQEERTGWVLSLTE